MLKRFLCLIVLTMGLVIVASPASFCAEELVVRPCADLIRLANSYQDRSFPKKLCSEEG